MWECSRSTWDCNEVAEKIGYNNGGLGKNATQRDERSAEDGRRRK
jgi:hypothetical protein